ncbi:hypothetical protein CN199_19145, partial [Sinorhizobium meliloti]
GRRGLAAASYSSPLPARGERVRVRGKLLPPSSPTPLAKNHTYLVRKPFLSLTLALRKGFLIVTLGRRRN